MTRGAPTTLNYFTAPPRSRARFVAWVVVATALVATLSFWIFFLRGDRILNSYPILIGGWIIAGVLTFLIFALLKTTPVDALRLSQRSSTAIILVGTALLQATAVALLVPALSEDLLRYRLDGHMWLEGYSPYATTPERFSYYQQVRGPFATTNGMVRQRALHTIDPPAAQAVFVGTRALEEVITPTRRELRIWSWWRNEVVSLPLIWQGLLFRIAFAMSALLGVAFLLSILAAVGRSPWYAVIIGWNPLFIMETGAMAHLDVVGLLFLLLTIRALQSNQSILATAMLALAAGVKPHVVLLAPFLVREAVAAGTRVRAQWLAVSFVLFLALVYSPMLYQQGYKGWLRTSHVYATSWEANGSVYELMKRSADANYSNDPAVRYWSGIENGVRVQRAKDRARMLAAAAVVVTMLIAWFGRADLATAGYWIFLVALLFSPVVYPWYLLWVLGFVPLLRGWPGMTALVWAATVGVSYLLWRTSDWVLPTRWLLVEYVPVYATLVLELVCVIRSRVARVVPALVH